MADRPRIADSDLERMAAVLAARDARLLRAYVAHHEQRASTWMGDVLVSIGATLSEIRRLADEAHATGRINGIRLDRLAEASDGLPARIEATLSPLHEAAARAMLAEAARTELANEAQRVEIEGRRKELEGDHDRSKDTRALLMWSLRNHPWFWVLVWLLAGSMGLSLSELGHLIGMIPADHVEAGAP